MINRKKKPCKSCGEDKIIFSQGMCLLCWKKANIDKCKIKTSKKKINKVSTPSKLRYALYRDLREEYLLSHPCCEVCKIRKSTEIHHKRGRLGEFLFKFFLAVCHSCHQLIESNPTWAKENEYSLSRIDKNETNENLVTIKTNNNAKDTPPSTG